MSKDTYKKDNIDSDVDDFNLVAERKNIELIYNSNLEKISEKETDVSDKCKSLK